MIRFFLVKSEEEIRLALLNEMELAHAQFDAFIRDFAEVAHEIDSGMRHPDGKLALRIAGDQRRRAFNALQLTISRYSSFVQDGIVPDHLRE